MMNQNQNGNDPTKDLFHGTTNIALKYKDGVVAAADKRASAGYMVASSSVKKIVEITDHTVLTIAGLPSDAMSLAKLLKAEIRLYEMNRDRKMTSKAIANLLGNILHNQFRTGFPYFVGLLLAGVDDKGPHVFNYDASGSITDDPFIAAGSGSPYAYGALEALWEEDMPEDQAIETALRALRSAVKKDLASGDGMDLYVIDKDGARELDIEDIQEILGDKYPLPKKGGTTGGNQ